MFPAITYTAVAVIGGFVRFLTDYLSSGVFHFWRLMAHLSISAFSGLMFAHAAAWLQLGPDAQFLLAGMGGWMGPQAADLLAGFITSRMNREKDK